MKRDQDAPEALLVDVEQTLNALAESDRTGTRTNSNAQRALSMHTEAKEQKLAMLSMLDCIHLPVGSLVQLTGLKGRPELNGRHGVVIGSREGARYPIHVCGVNVIHEQSGALFTISEGPGAGVPEQLRAQPRNLRHWLPDEAADPEAAALDLCRFAKDQDSVGLLEAVLGAMAEADLDAAKVLSLPVNCKHNRLLHNVAQSGHADFATALLECGADPMAQNVDGATALGVASYFGHDDVVRVIIGHEEGGVQSIHLPDYNGAFPLTCACCKGCASTVTLLLDGARTAAAQGLIAPLSQAQLHSAAIDAITKQQEHCIELLLAAGLDANRTPVAEDPDLEPLVVAACQESDGAASERLLKMILAAGAGPDLQASDGFTAFHLCCQKDHVRLAAILLAAGADPTIPSKLSSPVLTALDNDADMCAEVALQACRERATRLVDPNILAQAEADVASFGRLPRPSQESIRQALAAQGPGEDRALEHLESRLLVEGDEMLAEECAVCTCDFLERDRTVQLGCGHSFHALCISRCFDMGNKVCPLCRADPRRL